MLFPTAKSDPDLAPFRPGLVFGFFNAMAWQIGIGTPMVLFAEQLGATPFQVGLAYSFVFVLTPLQILATTLLPRYGFKAVMLGGWGVRSIFLGVPAMLAGLAIHGGDQPWMVQALVWSVFFFCVARSIGAASGTAWFYAILPEGVRGRYFSSDQFLSAVAGVGTLLASAGLFALLPTYPALLAQYVIALTGSTIAYFSLKRLPDAERPSPVRLATVLRDTPRHLFRPSAFRRYVWLAVGYAVISTPIPPFAAYYLKVVPQFTTGQIMLFEVLRFSGVMVAAWFIRKKIDAWGARPFFQVAVGLLFVAAVFWWFFLARGFGGTPGIVVVYFLLGIGAAMSTVANLNYLPKILHADHRTLAVAIHGAVTACLGGLSPVLWGAFLKTGEGGARAIDTQVFQWFFVSVAVGAVVFYPLFAQLPEDKSKPAAPLELGSVIVWPVRAATYLVNLLDVRPGRKSAEEGKPRVDAK